MNLKKMISATYKKAAIGISILMFATSAGYTFNPVEVKADDEKPAMNVEYHSKQDIVDYYNKHPFDGDMDTKYKEEPDVFAPYNLGSLTQKTIDNAQNMVNVVRYVAGLSGMTVEDASLSKSAQAAALANAANGELSHYPRRPRDMSDNMYNLAQEGASSSNIAMTSGRMTLPMSIRMYLSDADSGNRSRVGHRRWILYPTLYKIGFGQVEGYTATRVIGGERNYSAKEYGVAWPAQNTPVELLSYSGNSSVNLYPWSISFGQAPGSDINVTLINNQTGYSWHFGNDYADGEFYVNNGGYGQRGCVIFYPEYLHMSKGDSYTVQINNIGISGYQDTLTYNVNIFSLKDKDLSDDSDTSDKNGLCQAQDGTWNYYKNGKKDSSYTGLAGNEYGWFYVKNGTVDWEYNGLAGNEYGWFYVSNGVIDWNYTGLAGNEYGWFYVKNGVLDWSYTGVAGNEYGWFYIKNGVLDWSYTGVANNEYGWFYIKNGALDWSYTGLAYNAYGTWYIVNGAVAFDYTGSVNNVNVVNGQVVGHEHNWVHREDVYGEKFISKDNMKRYDDGTYIIDDGYEAVYESHIICGNCKKDFGSGDDAVELWAEHALISPLYTCCQNYFVEEILVGEKCTAVVTPAHDECSGCGVVKGE